MKHITGNGLVIQRIHIAYRCSLSFLFLNAEPGAARAWNDETSDAGRWASGDVR